MSQYLSRLSELSKLALPKYSPYIADSCVHPKISLSRYRGSIQINTMVFKPFTHLARQSLGKTFTHGYAQSVVAGSQSSYASSTTPFVPFSNHNAKRSKRPQTAQLHTAFQNAPDSSVLASKGAYSAFGSAGEEDGGLGAYYEAWQKQQKHGQDEKEWKQFQFAKRIGWKAPPVLLDGKGKERADLGAHLDVQPNHGGLDRAYSTSAVDDIKKAEDDAAEAIAVAHVDEAIASEIESMQQSSVFSRADPNSSPQIDLSEDPSSPLTATKRPVTPSMPVMTPTFDKSLHSTPLSDITAATSVDDSNHNALAEQLSKLHEAHLYTQIPPLFQSMLTKGLRPTVRSYNALLASAIHLPVAKHLIVPKALDVYSDMLKRKVEPDTIFYTTLIQLLSHRALEVQKMKDSLNKRRLRFRGSDSSDGFLFASNEAEYDILSEDNALQNAVTIFQTSTFTKEARLYSAETYRLLATACASSRRIDDMIKIYKHMESHQVKPIATMFPSMIEALARCGDLSSAVECYNAYRNLAIEDDLGELAIIDRKDYEVYAAVVKSYAICGKLDGGLSFIGKIVDSFANVTEDRKVKLEAVQDTVFLKALIEERLEAGDFSMALKIAEERNLTPVARNQAMIRISSEAADKDDVDTSTMAYQYLLPENPQTWTAALSMLALHIRRGEIDVASEYWSVLTSGSRFDASFIEPTASYALALIRSGRIDEGLAKAREGFRLIHAHSAAENRSLEVIEEIDEAIELIGNFIVEASIVPSPNASMAFLWAMIENGGLVSPVAERILAGLRHEEISSLSWQDTILALQVETGVLKSSEVAPNVAHSARFASLLNVVIDSEMPLDEHTVSLVESTLPKFAAERLDIIGKWQRYKQMSTEYTFSRSAQYQQPTAAIPSAGPYADTYDPYAPTADYKGSAIIIEELENHRNNTGLNEALNRFSNIRRAGRHPRYLVYAKLISSAAKEGRANLIYDILGTARHDMPFSPQFSVVRHGWASILDSVVGACLTVGNRTLATHFHQEMLEMGTAPTANTFGLYITTLKDSTKTFDEATEAVNIFQRALVEGVAPSSFLYNALIGKLGKARRIDDCLRYFHEMRAAGIRPTSVTYGTVVNALCRVSDDRFAEELFDEMESMPNYKPRPAPYNSLMQFFLTTKRDSKKVLFYYDRMQSRNIQPTMHTYKLLIDTYATLSPVNLIAAEKVLDTIRASGQRPEAVHYASLIHAKGCALHDMVAARQTFDNVLADGEVRPQACLYQALFESMVANHCVSQTEEVLNSMSANRVEMTPYIANTLIHGWAMENNIAKSKAVYNSVDVEKREPSTYEAMTRAYLTVENHNSARATLQEMWRRGYPAAVFNKVNDLVSHSSSRLGSIVI